MKFQVPREFEIPDDWWRSAGMDGFVPSTRAFVTNDVVDDRVIVVPLGSIEPPARAPGVRWFDRARMMCILQALANGTMLPPIQVHELRGGPFRYGLRDGFHRFFASAAAGFIDIPVLVIPYFDIEAPDA